MGAAAGSNSGARLPTDRRPRQPPGFFRSMCLGIVLAALSRCATVENHSGPVFDKAKIAQIVIGRSTMIDVEALFGKPRTLDARYDGLELATYIASDAETTPALDPNDKSSSRLLREIIFTFAGPLPSEVITEIQALEVEYSAQGTVDDVRLSTCRRNDRCMPLWASGP